MKPYLIIRTINQKLSLQESFKIVLIARVIGKAVPKLGYCAHILARSPSVIKSGACIMRPLILDLKFGVSLFRRAQNNSGKQNVLALPQKTG